MDKIILDKWYSLGEAALLLGESAKNFRRKLRDGKIEYVLDGTYKILGKNLNAYIERYTHKPAQ